MNFRTLMQTGPANVIELFAKLSETSEGAVKTREKLFAELKSELELYTHLEEQHLFPILRRNAETKGLVADAVKDNRELRAKLAELQALPHGDEAFPKRLKELQKAFRQHARDEKQELLPAVQRALSEEQVQSVTAKIEAGLAEAEQAKQDELEERRAKARHEREEARLQAERQAETERAQKEAEQAQKEKAASLRAREADAEQKRAKARLVREQAEQTALAQSAHIALVVENAAPVVERPKANRQAPANVYVETLRAMTPDLGMVTSLSSATIRAVSDIQTAWMGLASRAAVSGTQMSQGLLREAVERQRQFAADAVQGWMKQNARVTDITMSMAQESFRRFVPSSMVGSDENRKSR